MGCRIVWRHIAQKQITTQIPIGFCIFVIGLGHCQCEETITFDAGHLPIPIIEFIQHRKALYHDLVAKMLRKTMDTLQGCFSKHAF